MVKSKAKDIRNMIETKGKKDIIKIPVPSMTLHYSLYLDPVSRYDNEERNYYSFGPLVFCLMEGKFWRRKGVVFEKVLKYLLSMNLRSRVS